MQGRPMTTKPISQVDVELQRADTFSRADLDHDDHLSYDEFAHLRGAAAPPSPRLPTTTMVDAADQRSRGSPVGPVVASDALGSACAPLQQQEAIRASGSALGDASTVLLAQDTGALATLLSGSQGANIASVVNGV